VGGRLWCGGLAYFISCQLPKALSIAFLQNLLVLHAVAFHSGALFVVLVVCVGVWRGVMHFFLLQINDATVAVWYWVARLSIYRSLVYSSSKKFSGVFIS